MSAVPSDGRQSVAARAETVSETRDVDPIPVGRVDSGGAGSYAKGKGAGSAGSTSPLSVHPGRRGAIRKGIVQRTVTGTNRARPGLDQSLAAVRQGDTLVVPKLDRLARSVPDARAIADQLRERGVKLALGRTLYDPDDPMEKMFFNILATFAEFEADLIRMRTREGMAIARTRGKLRGK